MRRQILGLIGLVVVISCQDRTPSGVPAATPPSDVSMLISDGRTGGNPEAFWGTPLANNPQPGDLNFDIGAAHALLQPYVRICETDGTTPGVAGCLVDVTTQVTGSATGLVMSFNSGNEFYTTSLDTDSLVVTKKYRFEVWGVAFTTAAEKAALDPRWLFTYRDVANSPQVSACTVADTVCFINYGQNIPVKVRLEQFVFCPSTENCGMQFVSAGTDATLEATLGTSSVSALTAGPATTAQLHIPGQAGTNIAVAFEPCTQAEDQQVIQLFGLVTGGPCLKTVSRSNVTLGSPAIISFCDGLNPPDLSGYGFPPSQDEQVVLHHISEDLNQISALPEAWDCNPPTSGVASARSKGLLYYARALRDQVFSWATPKPLYASATMIDVGGGGQVDGLGSFFKLALPAESNYLVATDANQTGKAGDPVVLSLKVVDFLGAPIAGARVACTVAPMGTDGATVTGVCPFGPDTTDALGVAQINATLAATKGYNVFYVGSATPGTGGPQLYRGIADPRESGCTVPTGPCNGPRQPPAYDPFLPLHNVLDGFSDGKPVSVPKGTRLKFTIYGRGPSK